MEKLRLLNIITYIIKNTNNTNLEKLYKILYLADSTSFREKGRKISCLDYTFNPSNKIIPQITNDTYTMNEILFFIDNNNEYLSLKDESKFNDIFFSKYELNCLKKICRQYKNIDSKQILIKNLL